MFVGLGLMGCKSYNPNMAQLNAQLNSQQIDWWVELSLKFSQKIDSTLVEKY